MLAENYEKIEALVMNLSLVVLFIVMGMAVHDVLKKNDVPKVGRYVTYLVLGLGCLGFIAKGIIQFFWENQGL